MKSAILKRSVIIAGHRTSVSLEDDFWRALKEIAGKRGTTLKELVATIKADRTAGSLSSALRMFVLVHFQDQILAFKKQTP